MSVVERKVSFCLQDALEHIEQGLKELDLNDEWRKFLLFQSKFHNYSFQNSLLIFMQRPDASHVCGFNRWKSLNRQVCRGETAIRILAPCSYKVPSEKDKDDDHYVLKGFKVACVFDIGQTTGNDLELPVLVRGLPESDEDLTDLYQSLKKAIAIPVFEVPILPCKGCYNIVDQTITIKSEQSLLQRIKTLIHEFSHHLHHTRYFRNESRDLGEVVAESSAFIVASFLGIDTADYSIAYIGNWCQDIRLLKTVGDTVQRISNDIITIFSNTICSSTEANNSNAGNPANERNGVLCPNVN